MVKQDLGSINYLIGVLSIAFALISPFAGLIVGIIGFNQSKKEKTELSLKAKKLNLIGIILGAILTVVSIALTIYLTLQGGNILSFPTS